ncbi:hypothetical protein EV359DRAFT_60532 [Lentinula novae-zelandiae]|nr:hypothetical protein EV359DRAFT_60532 [Lentinula novae-zelandiae]
MREDQHYASQNKADSFGIRTELEKNTVSSIFSTARYLLADASDLNRHEQGKEDKIKGSHRTGLMVVIKKETCFQSHAIRSGAFAVQSTVGCHKSQVDRFTGNSSSLLLSSSFSTRVFSSIQFTPAHFGSVQSNLIVPSIPRSTSQSFAADHLHSTIVPMRLNIAFFVVSFAAAAYALPMADVSNTNASVADGRAGVVLPRANSDGFLQSNSGPPEPSTSGPPRPSISSRGPSETEKTSSKPLKYTFLGLEGETKSRDGGAYASQANQLTRELIKKHIPPGNALLKLEPSNEFLGDPDEVKFEVDLSQYGLGKCTAEIRTNTHAWMNGHAIVSAEWNGKSESYKPEKWSDPDFA